MLKKGLDVSGNNAFLITDLATVELKQYKEKPAAELLTEAEEHLQQAISLNASNANAHQKLSVVHYLKANYAKAWECFHQARTIDPSALDIDYLNDLLAKQPDPKGVFK